MIYLYGLLEPANPAGPSDPEPPAGVTGPVTITDLGAARLVHGGAGPEDILPKRRHLLAHARVLESVMRFGALLPMRFGMVADGIGEVEAMIEGRLADLEASFDAVRGHSEYGIRVRFPREAALSQTVASDRTLAGERLRLAGADAPQREIAEFGRRLADALDRRRAAAQRETLARLSPALSSHVLRVPESDVEILALDALVPDAAAPHLARATEDAALASGFAPGAEPEIRLVGPGPAYSFARLVLDAPGRRAA